MAYMIKVSESTIHRIFTAWPIFAATIFKDIDRSFLYIFLIKQFHRNIVFFDYECIYRWKGNYIVLILVKILLKTINFGKDFIENH